jgi:2-hydroxy-3-oxopropionate reductase
MAMAIGFIGLGTMGAPMVRRLLTNGHAVTVWARRRDAIAALTSAGARAGDSPADVASQADIVMTMVTDTKAVEDVVLGERGIAQGARAGSLVVDHSTITPDGARRIASALTTRGVEMLDAPVSGGSAAAEAGTLAIMMGGSRAGVERVSPVLSSYAKTIVHIGASGAGQVAKACNQICTIVNQLGAAEAMLLAERAGVDPRAVKEALMGGFAASRMLDLQAPKMIARDFQGPPSPSGLGGASRIESRLHHKDIHIVLEMARALGIELPASAAAASVLDRLQQRGGAREDSAAIFSVLDEPG